VLKISIDILVADSKMAKMTTSSDVSAAYCYVYHVSVMVPFIRWCQSPYLKAWIMFLFSSSASRNILVTYPWTSSDDRALDQVLEQSCPFRAHFFLWNSEWNFQSYHTDLLPWWNCGNHLLGSCHGASCSKLGRFITWVSPFNVVYGVAHSCSSY
jgi:hypothetical protein